jgi:hypothetical protein
LNNFASVISVPVEKDLGIDLVCELMEANNPTGLPFYIQCKGTKKAKKGSFFSIPIKVSTINYWLINKAPVLLILVDKKHQEFYWTYPYDQIMGRWKEIQKNKTLNIKISRENSFSFGQEEIPDQMDNIIRRFDSTDILMKYKEMIHGVSLQVGNIYELYREFKELKVRERSRHKICRQETFALCFEC